LDLRLLPASRTTVGCLAFLILLIEIVIADTLPDEAGSQITNSSNEKRCIRNDLSRLPRKIIDRCRSSRLPEDNNIQPN
jgi:hypothetical protein